MNIPTGKLSELWKELGVRIGNKPTEPETVTDANGIIWEKKVWDAPDGKKIEFLETDLMALIDLDRLQPELSWSTEYAPMEEPDVLQLTLTRWPKSTKVRALYASWADDGSDWQKQEAERGIPGYDGDGPTPLGPSSMESKLLFTYPNWRIDKDWAAVLVEITDEFVQWFKVDRWPWSEAYKLEEARVAKEKAEKRAKYPRYKRKPRNTGIGDHFWRDDESNWTDFMDEPF